jgi:hypothetical protein
MVARSKSYMLRLTKAELRAVQTAASTASPEQLPALEAIDGKLYGLLFPALVREPTAKRTQPYSLRSLGMLRIVRD